MKKPGVAQGLLLAGATTALGAIVAGATAPTNTTPSDPNASLATNIDTAVAPLATRVEGGAVAGALVSAAIGLVVLSNAPNLKRAAAGTLIGAGSLAFGALLLQSWPKAPATVA